MSQLHVIKVGGSLLAMPNAMRGVAAWVQSEARRGEKQLLVAGGGPAVEGLRVIDRANPLPREASHWAAVALMDANTCLLPSWIVGVATADSPGDAIASRAVRIAVPTEGWLRTVEPALPGERLTPGWQTTSDAIAARLAECVGARLTLLKRSLRETYADLAAAAAAGVVDGETPRLAAKLSRVRLVAFGGPSFSDFPIELLDSGWGADSTA